MAYLLVHNNSHPRWHMPVAKPEIAERGEAMRLDLHRIMLGEQADPEGLPTWGYLRTKRKIISDYWGNTTRIVSKNFKAIVESLEPDTHLFHPFRLQYSKSGHLGSEIFYQFNVLNVHQFLDISCAEGLVYAKPRDRYLLPVQISGYDKLHLTSSHPATSHFWLDARFLHGGECFVSDEAHAKLLEAGITGFIAIPITEE